MLGGEAVAMRGGDGVVVDRPLMISSVSMRDEVGLWDDSGESVRR